MAKSAGNRPANAPKPVVLDVSDDPNELEIEDPSLIVLGQIKAAQSAGGSDDFKVAVYQYLGANKLGLKMPYVTTCPPDDIPNLPEILAELQPDGGRFEVRVTKGGLMFRKYQLEILPRPESLRKIAPAAAPVADRSGDMMAIVREMMEESRRQTRELIDSMRQAPQSVGTSLKETLDLVASLQAAAPKPDPDLSLNMFNKGMELAGKMYELRSEGGGEGGGFGEIAKALLSGEGGQKLATVLAQALAPQQQQPQQQQQRPQLQNGQQRGQNRQGQQRQGQFNPMRHAEPPPPPPATDPMADAMAQLFEHARQGTDPGFVAETLLNTLPEPLLVHLENQGDVVAYLESVYPEVSQYKPWFAAVVAGMWEPDTTPQANTLTGADEKTVAFN